MEIDKLVKSLRDEHKRLGQAIAVLEGLGKNGSRRGARRMSAAGRARIAAAQRKRWRLLRRPKADRAGVYDCTRSRFIVSDRSRV